MGHLTAPPKIAVVTLLVALLATGCGESEADCWAKRQALIAEMEAVPDMTLSTMRSVYGNDVTIRTSHSTATSKTIERIQNWLAKDLPDC